MKLVPFVQVHTYKDVELLKVAKDGLRKNITSLKSFHIVYLSNCIPIDWGNWMQTSD